MNLKQAPNEDKLEEFMQEGESLSGDKVINSICQSKKSPQETSAQDSP